LVGCVQTEPSAGKGPWTHLTQQDASVLVQDVQDAQDAGSRLGQSGCNTTGSDAGHLFADALSFNPITNLSLNPFLIRNPTNITSASPTLPDSLSPLAYSADVFPSLLPPPSSLLIRSPLPLPPSNPSPSSPISGGPPPSRALSCGSLLSSLHPISPTPCLSPPPRPLTVCSRAPTIFSVRSRASTVLLGFSQPPRLIPVPVNLQLLARRLTQACAVYNHLPDTFPYLPNLQLPARCLTHTCAAYNHLRNSFSCLSCRPTRTLLLFDHSCPF